MQRNHPSSSSLSSSSSSLVVETQTVQSQFVLLTRARDGFRQEMEVCERERRRHEAAVATLRQVGLRLQQDITKAHAVLGTNTKKKQLLTAESQRLQTQLRQERAMLQDCQNQLQSLLDRCTKEKQGFCQEMDRLNQDTEQVLQQREGRHWCQLLLAPNAIPHLTAFGQSKGLEPLAPACIAMWEEALQQHNRCETLHGQLTTELQSWRERAQSTQPQNEVRLSLALALSFSLALGATRECA